MNSVEWRALVDNRIDWLSCPLFSNVNIIDWLDCYKTIASVNHDSSSPVQCSPASPKMTHVQSANNGRDVRQINRPSSISFLIQFDSIRFNSILLGRVPTHREMEKRFTDLILLFRKATNRYVLWCWWLFDKEKVKEKEERDGRGQKKSTRLTWRNALRRFQPNKR